jgi:glycosyltransferase involved in cell wall biosynthesis
MGKQLPVMLYVGDYPVQTGFGVVGTNLIKTFKKHYDVHVLGVNYYGDYNELNEGLKVYPASLNGSDIWGKDRLGEIIAKVYPNVVFILNDPWIGRDYGEVITKLKEMNPNLKTKFYLYTPVDAENVKQDFIDGLQVYDRVITYTEFGRRELEVRKKGEGLKNVAVVPHGVDTRTFYKIPDKKTIKKNLGLKPDDYVVLCLQRNQPRKRIDLTMFYFAEWVKRYNLPESVKFYYHGALQDFGIDILQWAEYLGIDNRMAISSPNIRPDRGLTKEQLNLVYNSADVFFTTTAAEGWCLPVAEAMAVGCPVIIPSHSALAEWPNGNAEYMSCYPFPTLTDRGLNTVHHVTYMESAIHSLNKLYVDAQYRKNLGDAGEKHMKSPKFNWEAIANTFLDIIGGKDGTRAVK